MISISMITDPRPLDPTFVPADVRHRDGEVDALTTALEPIIRTDQADPVILYGPSGTGKTCIAKYTVDQLHKEVINITHQYVNCWENYSRFETLYCLLEGIDRALDIHRQSSPTDELLNRLRDRDGPPYIVILDEVDQLEDRDVLYELYRTPDLSLVMIANREEELFVQLDNRLASRLHTAPRIQFDRYGVDELVAILEDRVRWGLHEDAVTTAQLEWIADAAAGDARIAIGILRNAAREATERGCDQLTDEIIADAEPETKAELQQKNIEKLTADQRILYDIIDERDEITPSDLYEAYRKRADDPKTERTVRNYLQKLEHYNLIVAEGENRGRMYRAPSQGE